MHSSFIIYFRFDIVKHEISSEVLLQLPLLHKITKVQPTMPVMVEVIGLFDDLEIKTTALPMIEAARVHLVYNCWPHIPLDGFVDTAKQACSALDAGGLG